MRLTTEIIIRLFQALALLDGHPVAGSERAIYKFTPAVKMKIARNIAALRKAHDEHSRLRDGLIYKHANGRNRLPDVEKLEGEERDAAMKIGADFEKAERLLLDQVRDVALSTLSEGDLNLKAN